MSARRHHPFSAAVSRLLTTCRGEGVTVAVMPEAGPSPHHFYAGVARAPAVSFLEALLLLLGGDDEAGRRRYDEIVVINAGVRWNDGMPSDSAGPDKPPEETIRLPQGKRGAVWCTWWFRRPPEPTSANRVSEDSPEQGRPDPLNRRRRWADVARQEANAAAMADEYPDQVPATEAGPQLPKRHKALRDILVALSKRSHPTLLLLEIAVLDYPSTNDVPQDHGQISDDGLEQMAWLPQWIDERVETPSQLDLVLYSRNRRRIEAFLGPGLPRRPEGLTGQWHATSYHGRNLPIVEYPWGPFPWGESLFSGDRGFQELDGTAHDSPEGRRSYPGRTLRALLRGQAGSDGQTPRLRLGAVRPLVPPRGAATTIDRVFWSQVDVAALRSSLEKAYFGASDNQPITNLLATIEYMQEVAAEITDPASFHEAVRSRWTQASSLLLWGEGGTGKSFLGELLGDLVFGHEPLLVSCQQTGGGSHQDPVSVFRSRFFGPPAGFVGGDQLTDVGQHLVTTDGLTVVILDEVNDIAPGDFGRSMKTLYGVLHDREYSPQNPGLIVGRRIPLWNTIFVLTANLAGFPPKGTRPQDREAMARRVTDHEFRLLDDEQVERFVPWYLPRAVEKKLGQRMVCTCGPLEPALVRNLGLEQRSPDRLTKELDPMAEEASSRVRARLEGREWPLLVDITDAVREALTHGPG